MLLESTQAVMGELGQGACAQGNREMGRSGGGPKCTWGSVCASPPLKQGALVRGESESLILLPDSTETNDSSNSKARKILVMVTGLSWLWGCLVGFFKVLLQILSAAKHF